MQIRVLGAGYAGLRAALDLDRWLGDRDAVQITLIDRHDYHQLVTELHKPAAGTGSASRLAIPLRDILKGTRIRFCQRAVKDILPDDEAVVLEGGTVLRYQRLVVALGSSPEYFAIPGVAEHALTIRSINSARTIWNRLEWAFRRAAAVGEGAEREALLTVVVAGGGFTGVELAGELADRLPVLARDVGAPPEAVRIVTVEALPELLSGFSPRLVAEAARALEEKKVHLVLGAPITRVDEQGVELEDGRRIASRTVIWTGGVRGHPIVERRFPCKGRGRAEVDPFLRSPAYPNVYIIGDAAFAVDPRTGRPVAPTAQHAIEQGRVAARNIWAGYTGRPLRPYRPINKGIVVSVGRGVGLARLGRYDVSGAAPAVLKDAITWLYVYSLGGYRLVLRYALAHLGEGRDMPRVRGEREVPGKREGAPAGGRAVGEGAGPSLGERREAGDGHDAARAGTRRRLAAFRAGELPPGADLIFPDPGGDGAAATDRVPLPSGATPRPAAAPEGSGR